ncbi:hypothetical protein ADL15_37205 [Actinoplanes awajinensis subsp. mycoplanecinus]|uniref:Uncharacterized protein n=1 Tax=Actinoplanes awajinensis subsp. mycoplanecinus TaxID=135947 RepID=A0A101JHF1_9ACTN|nr:hypothetical protein ADL15_37205 [Actinoplanes awajinensis subsp. mycoplanecinus]
MPIDVSDDSAGKLTPLETWREALPRDVFAGLVQWARGQHFDVRLLGWNTDGRSDSHVASVALERVAGGTSGAILKILPPDLAQRESRAVGIAADAGPAAFVDAHLTRTLHVSALPGDSGRWVHLQDVAHAGTEQLRALSTVTEDTRLGDYCAVILTALAREWNTPENEPRHTDHTPADFLRNDLTSRVSDLRAFAVGQGWDRDDPPPVVRFPDDGEPLTNPLLLLSGDDGRPGRVTVFRGRGHGDLHPGNIMVPVVRDGADASRFRLIDIGRFSITTPLSRDPAKLLLAIAEGWLANLSTDSPVRTAVAQLITDPRGYHGAVSTAGFVAVARQVYESAALWAADHRSVERWERQHRLVLGASALRTVSRPDVADHLRWWNLEVAARALAPFLPPPGHRAPAVTRRPATAGHAGTPGTRPYQAPPATGDSPEDDLHRLASILREALTAKDERKLIILVGAGITAARVPRVARLTTWALDFADRERLTRPRTDPNEPRSVNPGVQQSLISKYVEALDFIREVRGTDGLRAFLQQVSLQAHDTGKPPPLTGEAMPDPDYRQLEGTPAGWQSTEGLTLLAGLLRQHGRNVHPFLLTTNFDPLLEVALRRAGLDLGPSRAVRGPGDPVTDLGGGTERWTVVHLHGTPHTGSLHYPADIGQPHRHLERWLTSILRGNRLLVLGYSGWDGLIQRTLHQHFGRGGEEKYDQGAEVLWGVYEPRPEHPNVDPELSEFFGRYDQRGVMPFYGVSADDLFRILGEKLNNRRQPPAVHPTFYSTVKQLSQRYQFGHSHVRPETVPNFVFWPHRLRHPHLIHGVHALTAALLSKRNVPIELHLDDTDMTTRYADERAEEFADAVSGWFERCGAHEPPRIFRIQEMLKSIPEAELSARLWRLGTDLFSRENSALDALLATKVVKADRGATIVDHTSAANRLLRPLYTWLALDLAQERHRHRDRPVVTLGGVDEQKMWDLWSARRDVVPIASIYVPRLQSPDNPWEINELWRYGTFGLHDLERLLVRSAGSWQTGAPLLEWIFNVANRLTEFASDGAVPALRNPDDTTMSWPAFAAQLHQIPEDSSRRIAEIIGAWFYHDAATIR